jgi:hypothetical protein
MKSYEEKESHFQGRLTRAALLEFVGTATRPLVMELGQRLANKVLASPIRSHFLFFSHKMDKEHRDRMRMVGDRWRLYTAQCSTEQYSWQTPQDRQWKCWCRLYRLLLNAGQTFSPIAFCGGRGGVTFSLVKPNEY